MKIPRPPSGGTTQFLDELPGAVWVVTGCVQQGFAEGIAILLLADAGSLLSAHVLIFVLEVRAKSQEPCSPRGAVIFQSAQKKSTEMNEQLLAG